MLKRRKISGVEIDISRVTSRKRVGKSGSIEEKLGKMDTFTEDYQPGRYVRLLKKPSVTKKGKKKPKKLTQPKENFPEIEFSKGDVKVKKVLKVKLENDTDCNKILKQLSFDKPSVMSGINALFKVLEQKRENDNQLLDLDTPIFLQLASIKIPICAPRTLRLPLKHSLHHDDCTVCFIVSDVNGILRKEHEKVVEHYEKLFSDKGVTTRIHKILPLHELKTEYGEFEMKRKLLSTYDVFFVDGRISRYVSRQLGNIFFAKRRTPVPINFARDLGTQTKYAMLRTSLNLHGHGNSHAVQIGHCKMTVQQIYENILSVCSRLIVEYPGGWANVKAVNLKTDLSMAIPLYLSLKNPSEVKTPKIGSRRPKAYRPYTGELSTKHNSRVTVYPSGHVVVEKVPSSKRRKLGDK